MNNRWYFNNIMFSYKDLKALIEPDVKIKIELYLFCYEYADDVKSFIKELVDSNDKSNLELALAILENNYEMK